MSNISDVLKQLETLSVESGVRVFVPSLQREVLFKPLNLKQQKELLKTTIDESLIKLAFNNLLTSIIKENALEPIETRTLYPFDRTAIAIALRSKGLDSNITINEKQVSLSEKLEEIKSYTPSKDVLSTTITEGLIALEITAPNLDVDREINQFALSKNKATQENDIKTVISDLVVYEFTKFINNLTIREGESVTTTHFSSLRPGERVTIAEKLPSTITNKIFEHVKTYRAFESRFTQVGDENIEIDGNFFTI